MRRFLRGSFSLALVLAFLPLGFIPIASAQDTATPDYAGHPLVGTWALVIDDETMPDEVMFTADGGFVDVETDGGILIGAWEPTGDSTANVTINSHDEGGTFRIRAAIEVAADGQTFTLTYTFELVDPGTGEGSGEYGPGTGTGTRAVVEGPGTPVGSLDDLFGQFEQATPGATPVSDQLESTVQVTLEEFLIQADQSTLTAGMEYTFLITNIGVLVHEFVIEPVAASDEPLEVGGRESEVEDIAPGASAQLTWTFDQPGRYRIACYVPGHFEEGMSLEFEVVAP